MSPVTPRVVVPSSIRRSAACLAVAILATVGAELASAGITRRASVSTAGAQGDDISGRLSAPSLDATGRRIAFDSQARTLISPDTNGRTVDVFVHDRDAGTTVVVSVSSAGAQGDRDSSMPALSGDGRFVAFQSTATNLVLGDTNSAMDVFVHDLETGTTERVNVSAAGEQASGGWSFFPAISFDGRYVAFSSDAQNLVPGDAGLRDVFVRDRLLGTTERVSVATDGTPSNNDCAEPAMSPDGRYVAFPSFASNLAPGDTNVAFDVFLRDRTAGTTERVSVDSAGLEADGPSAGADVSADGRLVAFYSDSSNLVPGDANMTRDMFVHDRTTGVTERVNVSSVGAEADSQSGFSISGRSTRPRLSADGRFVAFDSSARNLVSDDTNEAQDVFVRDRLAGTTVRVSVTSGAGEASDGSTDPAITADGLGVAFISKAPDLIPDDTNTCLGFPQAGACVDVFANVRVPCSDGTVNAGAGLVTDVLRVNGDADFALVRSGAAIELRLDAAPAGPSPARYAMWFWLGFPVGNASDLVARGETVGCTVSQHPFGPGASPRPFRCLLGAGMPPAACRNVHSIAGAPASAPWSVAKPGTFAPPVAFITVQGLLEDAGSAASGVGFSVTNAVVVEIRR